jgi:predicted phage-related endonuclease
VHNCPFIVLDIVSDLVGSNEPLKLNPGSNAAQPTADHFARRDKVHKYSLSHFGAEKHALYRAT